MAKKQPVIAHQTHAQQIFFSWFVDVLTYILILNLLNQYVDWLYIDNFALSVLVALAMKVMMVLILGLKDVASRTIKSLDLKRSRGAEVFVKFLILFSSKFFVIEVLNLLFNEYVNVNGFFSATALILVLMLSRLFLEAVYLKLGEIEVQLNTNQQAGDEA